ncbi:MAG: hypothetical protein L6R40_005640 [Gallowayella cf. fulva]|nr:MAG: hypothetical protein L6R40_005640 [Xanthomendoza cf. fulva]
MHASISVILATSSLYFSIVAAAPVATSQSVSPPITPTTPSADTATVTPMPIQRRQVRNGDINILNDLVIPQSASTSSSTNSSSSTFAFIITRPTKAAAKPAKLADRDAAKLGSNEDRAFGALADLSFPQKISSSSATPTPTPMNELNINRRPAATPAATATA